MPETKLYKVLFPHVRNIGGQVVMFEPMLSDIVKLPDDDETKAAVEAGWLQPFTPPVVAPVFDAAGRLVDAQRMTREEYDSLLDEE